MAFSSFSFKLIRSKMEATSMANMMIGDMILGQTRAGFFAITREFEEANMGILRNNNAG